MPQTVSRTCYTFAELSDKAKDKAIEDARQSAAEFWEADHTLDDALEILAMLGFHVDNDGISYSGFCSQGDGASFVGTWYPEDVKVGKVAEHAPEDADLAVIAREIERYVAILDCEEDKGVAIVRRSGQYCHEMTVGFEFDWSEGIIEDTRKPFIEACRDLMRWIYRQLEADYTWATSDDTIRENLTEGDTLYRENGRVDY